MRAIQCHALVGPSGLQVDQVDAPRPGEGEIAVAVRAAGVNFPDVLLSWGKYQFKPALPFIPGGEGAGVVCEVGANVHGLAVGDRVAFTTMQGAFAEQIVVPVQATTRLPESVSFEVGAATLLTFATTFHALHDRAHLKQGETLAVLGAAGGVGVAAIQLGKMFGARVIAAASSAAKLEFCRRMGADEGIDTSREDLKERLKTLTNGQGADVVYDPVGGALTEAAVRAMAWEGRLLVVGFASGDIARLPLNLTLLKGCSVMGVFWGAFAMRDPARNQANCERILAEVAKGTLRPHVHAQWPFEQARQALEQLEQRQVLGKVLLVP